MGRGGRPAAGRVAPTVLWLVCLAAAVGLTACTSGGSPSASSTPLPLRSTESTSAAPTASDSSTPAPATSAGISSSVALSSAGITSQVPVTASGGPSSTVVSEPGCRTADLSLQVVRGASSNQHAYADLVLTNKGAAACSMSGFPGVSLLAGGNQIGPDATRAKTGYAAVSVAPGQTAHATLAVSTACNAPRSDSVRVYPPNNTAALVAALAVYACSSEVSPVSAGPA